MDLGSVLGRLDVLDAAYMSCVVYLAGAVVDASVREEATGGEA